MAIGWLSLLKHVPWSEVISNAPAVAEGAKKLWSAAAKGSIASPAQDTHVAAAGAHDGETVASLRAQVAALETAAADLHEQMLASSAVIKALAEQNTELVKRVESNRVLVLWLSAAVAVVGFFTALAVAVLLNR